MKDISVKNKKEDSNNNKNLNMALIIVTAILVGFGLIMVYSTTSVEASTSSMYDYNGYYFLIRQLRGVVLGLVAVFIIMKLPLNFIKKIAWPLLIISIAFLVLTIFIGVERNGAKRWIEVAGFSFQSSELCKIALVIFMASYLSGNKKYITSFWRSVFPLLIVAGTMFALIEEQPDLGTIIGIATTFMFILLISGVRFFHLVSMILVGVMAGSIMIIDKPYRVARMFAFLNPWKDPEAAGFHIIQSLLAFGSGGIWGLGFGHSRQKLFYLPEHHTDFIFAVIGEELGFIGTCLMVLLFLAFAYTGFKIALSQKDVFSFLLASGMTGSVVIQAFINMGVASSMMPLTGLTLPFISFGSTSMIISLICVGIILKVSMSPPLLAVRVKPGIKDSEKSSYTTDKLNLQSYPTSKFDKKRYPTNKLIKNRYPTSRLKRKKRKPLNTEDKSIKTTGLMGS